MAATYGFTFLERPLQRMQYAFGWPSWAAHYDTAIRKGSCIGTLSLTMCCWTQMAMCTWRILYVTPPPHRDRDANARQNVASEYKLEKQLHSKSGTLAYLAPEVYAGTGYLTEVDWWSLGVTFYECIYNKVGSCRGDAGASH